MKDYASSPLNNGTIMFKNNMQWINLHFSPLTTSLALSFFKIPRCADPQSQDIHDKWKESLGVQHRDQVHWLRICELHFVQDCFMRDLESELMGRPLRKRLKPDAIPTIFLKTRIKDLEF